MSDMVWAFEEERSNRIIIKNLMSNADSRRRKEKSRKKWMNEVRRIMVSKDLTEED